MIDKPQLRKKALAERKLLTEEEFQKKNNSLIDQLQAFISKQDFQTIHIFLPIANNREPDMTSLFKQWWNEGRKIMVGKTDFKLKEMSHYWLTKSTMLEVNSWGIPEPVDARLANIQEVVLLVVPLLVVDKKGNRIGYGGGYYDKLLKQFRGQSLGLSLFPKVDHLEADPWDVPLDDILTA